VVDIFFGRLRDEVKKQEQNYELSDLHSSAVFSALSLRSLRLCGDSMRSQNSNRRDAENAEVAQRKPLPHLISCGDLLARNLNSI